LKKETEKIRVRVLIPGFARAKVLGTSQRLAFLQGVDPESGKVIDKNHELFGRSIAGRVLIFPHSIGSSVGAYTLYRLAKKNLAPKGIINKFSDIVTVSGCAIGNIPLVDSPQTDFERLAKSTNKVGVIDSDKSCVGTM
jgi:predicted aconitase with swiveling domain